MISSGRPALSNLVFSIKICLLALGSGADMRQFLSNPLPGVCREITMMQPPASRQQNRMGDLEHDGGFCTTHEPHYSSENHVLKNNPTRKESKKRKEKVRDLQSKGIW